MTVELARSSTEVTRLTADNARLRALRMSVVGPLRVVMDIVDRVCVIGY